VAIIEDLLEIICWGEIDKLVSQKFFGGMISTNWLLIMMSCKL
jgi:hypothetical protein